MINVIGGYFDNTGYGSHTRGLCSGLQQAGAEVRITCNKPDQWERMVKDWELLALTRIKQEEETMIFIATPESWNLGLAEKPTKFYGYVVFEGDKIPEGWFEYLLDDRVDGILVPSRHVYDAIQNTLMTVEWMEIAHKIFIIPHGVDQKIFYPEEIKKEHDEFVFLANKGWKYGENDRGGLQYLIKAYVNEFTEEDKVRLILKINSSYNSPQWNFDEEMEKIGIKKSIKRPRIFVATQYMIEKELNLLYNEADVFVNPSMGEAFGIPMIEAMSCGVPVLTTPFGGQSDFVNNENGWLLEKGELGEFSVEILYEGIKWFKPDITELQQKMSELYNNQQKINIKKDLCLKKASEYTWLNSAKKLLTVIDEQD